MVNLSLVGRPRLLADDAGSEKSETEPSETGTAKQKGHGRKAKRAAVQSNRHLMTPFFQVR
jgi:hypothetical protein